MLCLTGHQPGDTAPQVFWERNTPHQCSESAASSFWFQLKGEHPPPEQRQRLAWNRTVSLGVFWSECRVAPENRRKATNGGLVFLLSPTSLHR